MLRIVNMNESNSVRRLLPLDKVTSNSTGKLSSRVHG